MVNLSLQDINEELDLATESFLEGDACKIDVDKKEVRGKAIHVMYFVGMGDPSHHHDYTSI